MNDGVTSKGKICTGALPADAYRLENVSFGARINSRSFWQQHRYVFSGMCVRVARKIGKEGSIERRALTAKEPRVGGSQGRFVEAVPWPMGHEFRLKSEDVGKTNEGIIVLPGHSTFWKPLLEYIVFTV